MYVSSESSVLNEYLDVKLEQLLYRLLFLDIRLDSLSMLYEALSALMTARQDTYANVMNRYGS